MNDMTLAQVTISILSIAAGARMFGDAQRQDDLMSGINFVLFMGGLLVAHNIG